MSRSTGPAAFPAPFLPLVASILSAVPAHVAATENTLAPVFVTASRTPQVTADVLSDTLVITAEEIAQSADLSLVDLLQRQRGIEVTRTGGRGANASVFLRGADNRQNIVLVDGVRVGSATSGGANWSAIPLAQIERVEVVFGPMSSLYGADAMGGVIQIFTRRGEPGVRANASASAGSHDTRILDAGISGASGRLRFAVAAAHEESDGFSSKKPGVLSGFNPDRDGYRKESANGSVGFELAKGHEIGASFLRSRLYTEYDNTATLNDHQVQHVETYALTSSNRITSSWNSRVQLARAYDKGSNYTTTVSRFNTRQNHLSWQNDIQFGKDDLVQLIVERREEEVDSTTTALNRTRSTNSVAAAYQLKRGAHLGSLIARNDNNSQFGSFATGSIGYGYWFTDALRANASLGTSFRAPTFNELYFPSFGFAGNAPERGRNMEVGLRYDTGATRITASWYRNRIRDLLVTARPCPVPGFGTSCSYNVNEAILTGVSLGASTRLGNFVYRATVDLQDPKDETTGLRLARRARAHGTLGVEYDTNALGGPLVAGIEAVLSGKRFDDTSNLNRLPGYGLVNLHASYEFARNWTVFGRWNNVFDKDYELARGYATEGSAVFVGIRYAMR